MPLLPTRISRLLMLVSSLVWVTGTAWGQALSQTKDEISYRIREGDSLMGLGRRYFVSPDSYKTVQRHNSLSNPDSLRVGKMIVIPTSVLRYTRLEARVIAYTGHASIGRNGRADPVSLQTKLSEGAVVETAEDGYLTLQLANGSKISLPSNSRLRVARMRTYLLTGGTDLDFMVERGRTETSATPLRDNRSRFRMRTPVAVSAVRGTVFRIGYDGPNTPSLTEVVEGTVAVNLNATAAQTSLPTGFGAAGSADGRLKREELLPPPEFVSPASLQRGRDVAFAFRPDPGAVGYHVQVAQDREFVDVVTSARSTTPQVNLGQLAAGKYFVRAMAIAPSGLEGMPQTQAFERRLESLVARRLPGASRSWQLDWDLGESSGTFFRLQLFDGSHPETPVIDEPGLTTSGMRVQGLPTGKYTWRVGQSRITDGKIQQSWTRFESFTVEK